MDMLLPIFLVLILVLAGIVLVFVIGKGRSAAGLNKEKYHSAWLGIEQQLNRNDDKTFFITVLNADKLLDQALRERGFRGQTMGERMKSANSSWTNANHVWHAHKLRNQIAHETNARVSFDDTRRALAAFKQALKDMGAI
jgi:formiminotetrahydrofolate cyclodeaminase